MNEVGNNEKCNSTWKSRDWQRQEAFSRAVTLALSESRVFITAAFKSPLVSGTHPSTLWNKHLQIWFIHISNSVFADVWITAILLMQLCLYLASPSIKLNRWRLCGKCWVWSSFKWVATLTRTEGSHTVTNLRAFVDLLVAFRFLPFSEVKRNKGRKLEPVSFELLLANEIQRAPTIHL